MDIDDGAQDVSILYFSQMAFRKDKSMTVSIYIF